MRDRPTTRRGLLGTIMSPYDPMGIAAPAMLKYKLFQREVIPPSRDDPHNYHTLDPLAESGAMGDVLADKFEPNSDKF